MWCYQEVCFELLGVKEIARCRERLDWEIKRCARRMRMDA
jgi:hypothetical protein